LSSDEQGLICARFGVDPDRPLMGERVGINPNVLTDLLPLNALRHPGENGTCGWYIWAGEELSDDPSFFVALHVEHLAKWCPAIVPYLALPAGYRVLLAPDFEDVWFDEALLTV
jgi:hypothetical protein